MKMSGIGIAACFCFVLTTTDVHAQFCPPVVNSELDRDYHVGHRAKFWLQNSQGCVANASVSVAIGGYIAFETATSCYPPIESITFIHLDAGVGYDFNPSGASSLAYGGAPQVDSGSPGAFSSATTRDFGVGPQMEHCGVISIPKGRGCGAPNYYPFSIDWTVVAFVKEHTSIFHSCPQAPTFYVEAQWDPFPAIAVSIVRAGIIYLDTGEVRIPHGFIHRGDRALPVNVSQASPGEPWGFADTVGFDSVGTSVGLVTLSFADEDFDLDSDGRFSELDVAIISAQILGSAVGYEKFDLNDNQIIDSIDVQILTALLEQGYGAGILGDVNRDGVLDCSDVDMLTPFPTSVLGDTDYYSEADFDLDGDNDVDDAMAVWAALRVVQPADVNLDGVVDIVDLLDFLDAFATCDGLSGPCFAIGGTVDADFNGDGLVDINDQLDFYDAYSSACP